MSKCLDIYIDGSHLDKQNNGRLGIGGVIVDFSSDKKGILIQKFSYELTNTYMKQAFGADSCSNPSAELTALLMALREFKTVIKNVPNINVHADYLGVKEWMTGNWKIKEPYIQNIKSSIDSEIIDQNLRGRINYLWVKGHQSSDTSVDAYWNNYVDKLAKGNV